MTDQPSTDLHDLLDSSFGDGPPAPAPTDRLAPARSALRRRRWLSGGGTALAVAAAVTSVALLSGPGSDGTRAVAPADGGPAEPTTSATSEPAAPSPTTGGPVTLEEARDLLAAQDQDGGPGESQLVRFASGLTERLEARGDARILAQSADVDLPANFAERGQRSAVAKVRDGDLVVYVLARQVGPTSRPEYIAFEDAQGRYPTIAAFLELARTQYASEEGLR